MARKKKKKLVVELDLPKDDKTLKNLYIIIFFSVILGLSSGIMWVTNSGFIPTANGEPMFTNVFCGATAQDDLGNDYSAEFSGNLKPTYQANESCSILQDDADHLEWSESPWVNFVSKGKTFDVPGMPEQNKGSVVIEQPLSLDCTVEATTPTDYLVVIRDSGGEIVPGGSFEGKTGRASDVCNIEIDNMEPDTRYEIAIFSLEDGKRISSAQFDMTVDFYDGIPTNMNNKSLWLGPKVELGPLDLRPMIFLNFFGLTFFFLLYPASYYWERVETKKNEIEEKFGKEVLQLVNGVTKLSKIETYTENKFQAENFRKLILAMSKDIRVLLVKLADRLHNMRTIQFIPQEKRRQRIASETLEIYAPLAGRLGMHEFKDELEDLSFQILNPSAYSSLMTRIEYLKKDKSNLTDKIKTRIFSLLEKNEIDIKTKIVTAYFRKISYNRKIKFNF